MELRHLRYFVAVAEELSFSAAARRLHLAQPPLSVQVRQLEEELGVRLLERTSRRVRLTPPGELFLERARSLLRESAAAVREVQRAGRGELGRLRLSFSGATFSYDLLLPEVLRGYHAAHPGVSLTLHEQAPAQQMEEILAGRVEAGFLGLARADTDAAEHGELATECLLKEPLFAVLPEGHPLARRRRISQAQIEAEALVWMSRQGVFLREGGFDLERGEGSLEVNSVATVFNSVAAGFGVSILPRQFTSVAVPGLCFVPFSGGAPFRYGMVWRRCGEKAEPLASLLACAREVAARRQATGKGAARSGRGLGAGSTRPTLKGERGEGAI